MTILRRGLFVFGLVLIVFGVLFALQGADIVHWPLESTMLGRSVWIGRGLMVAALGVATIFAARRIG
jgi:hypothetical protein